MKKYFNDIVDDFMVFITALNCVFLFMNFFLWFPIIGWWSLMILASWAMYQFKIFPDACNKAEARLKNV